MARAIWSGNISFGLLNVPVKLYSAVSRRQISFRELRESDSSRVRHKRVAEADGEEVSYDDIVKGYELSPDQYVVFSRDELDELVPKKTKAIEVEAFVDLDDIDPIYFVQPYYLAPEPGAERAYELLVKAMADERKVAIARFVLRNKEHLAALRPMGDVLTLTTMRFADEIVPPEELDVVPEDAEAPRPKELEMAKQLVGSLTSDFDPEQFHDEYREELLAMIERKAQGEDVVQTATDEPAPTKAPDLMAALEESLAAVKGEPLAAGSKSKTKTSSTKRKSTAKSGSSSNGRKTSSSSKAKSPSKSAAKTSSRSRSKAKAGK